MPAGHLLSEGQYINKNVSEDELWSAFSRLFSAQSKNSTSYKFAFLKSLLDNLYNVDSNLQLTFDAIFAKFAESYWNLVLKYGIRQQSITRDGRISAIEGILREAATRFHIADGVPFEQLNDDAMIFVCDNTKRKCKINVVGALYADLGGMAYSFSRSGEWLRFSPYMYEFLCKHKLVIEKMNYYEWARYMEKVNDDSMVVHLLTKIECSTKRSDLSVYRHILYDEFECKRCFYCGRPLKESAIHVDHFIPWSFIRDDKLWNFVLACPQCNESKSDKLAAPVYLEQIIRRNNASRLAAYANKIAGYRSDSLRDIYNWARTNGYSEIWEPKKRIVL